METLINNNIKRSQKKKILRKMCCDKIHYYNTIILEDINIHTKEKFEQIKKCKNEVDRTNSIAFACGLISHYLYIDVYNESTIKMMMKCYPDVNEQIGILSEIFHNDLFIVDIPMNYEHDTITFEYLTFRQFIMKDLRILDYLSFKSDDEEIKIKNNIFNYRNIIDLNKDIKYLTNDDTIELFKEHKNYYAIMNRKERDNVLNIIKNRYPEIIERIIFIYEKSKNIQDDKMYLVDELFCKKHGLILHTNNVVIDVYKYIRKNINNWIK